MPVDETLCPHCDIGLDVPCLRSAHKAKMLALVPRGAAALEEGVWRSPTGIPCRPDEIAHAVLTTALRQEDGR